MPETLTDAQKVLRNDTGKRIAVALEALASEVEPSTVIAPEYDAEQTYAVGDLVIYRSVLYRCTTAITTPEEWTAEHWEPVTVGAELKKKYEKPSGGIPKTDLSSGVQTSLDKADSALQSVPSTYRTAAAQDVIDAAQNTQIAARAKADEIGIVITGNRPSMAASAGQYVIVRGSTISGKTDGLYTAVNALSPSTDVSAADLTAVSVGGLNDLAKKWVAVPAGDIEHIVDPDNPDDVNGTLSAYVNKSLGLGLVQWQGNQYPLSAVNHNFRIPPDIASKYRLTMPMFTNDGTGFLLIVGNTVRVRVTTATANSSGSIFYVLS